MTHERRIPLWMPIGALALVLFAVGWIRTRHAQPAALAPGHTVGSGAPDPIPDSPTRAREPIETPPVAQPEPARVAPAVVSEALAPVVLVHGRVLDASGAPLSKVMLTFVDGAGHPASVNQSQGTYLTGGLAPGRWIASLRGQGLAPLQETLELAAEPALVEHDFVAEVRRRVPVALRTPEGAELGAVLDERRLDTRVSMRLTILATREESPPPFKPTGLDRLPGNTCGVYTERDMMGRPPLPEGCSGTFEFRAAPPLWMHVVLGHERLASMRIDEIPERLDLVVDPDRIQSACGSVILRAVDAETGAALANAGANFGTMQSASSMTKEGEQLAVHDLSPGAYYFWLTAPGRCMIRREFVLAAGETLDLGDVPMPAPRPLKLHFTDTDGRPLEVGFNLYALVPGDPRATKGRFQDSMGFKSDADGVASLSSLAPGKWVVRINRDTQGKPDPRKAELGARPWVLDATCTECPESTLVLEPTSELTLVPASAASIGLSCWIDTPDGLPVESSRLYDLEARRLRLAPGPYTLTVEDEDGVELMRRPFEMGSAAVEIRMPR